MQRDVAGEEQVVDQADKVAEQHRPEAGPGPHDSAYLFDDFN